jgi:hypothetical protein
MEKHVTLVGVFHIGFSILRILAAMAVFVILVGSGRLSGDPHAMAVTYVIGSVIAYFLVIVSIPGIIGGVGLLKRQNWARIVLLIVAVLDLLHVPFGTALGIYTIWVLVHEDTKAILATPHRRADPV